MRKYQKRKKSGCDKYNFILLHQFGTSNCKIVVNIKIYSSGVK